jgi:methylmalonyl-CoA/ethylmalonyl-CoA epimerase
MDYKVDHIGIAVKDLNTSIPLFEKLLGSNCYKTELVASEQVETAFFLQKGSKIELVQSIQSDGVISK